LGGPADENISAHENLGVSCSVLELCCELKLWLCVRDCARALNLVCVALPTLTFVLLCDHQL
jgi:hypothetical protein